MEELKQKGYDLFIQKEFLQQQLANTNMQLQEVVNQINKLQAKQQEIKPTKRVKNAITN